MNSSLFVDIYIVSGVHSMSKILGNEFSEEHITLFRSQVPTVILATVSRNGFPNTTPVHLVWAKDTTTVLMALARAHRAVENIRSNEKVMVNVCEEGDINISFSGKASILKEELVCNRSMCILEVKVLEIKDDSTHSETTCGIRYRCRTERGEQFIRESFEELKSI